MYKIRQKIISAFAALSLLLNSFIPLLSVSPVYAQEEATDSAELILQEVADPSPVPEPSPSPSATPTLTPSLDESLTTPPATQSAIIDTSTTENQSSAVLAPPLWQTNSDGSVTTTNVVTLNTTYQAPQNDKVTITFTKLPEGSGTVTVKEIKLTEEQVKETDAFSDTAYEITSTMQDATFEYTLTLPTPTTQNVEVKVSEDGQTFVTLGGVSAGDGILTISGLNHFTIFVVTDPFPNSSQNVLINEVMINPTSGGEWVEVYNNLSETINLTGWYIDDSDGDTIFLSGTLNPGAAAFFERASNDPMFPNTGIDDIFLYDGGDSEVDHVQYDNNNSTNNLDLNTDPDKSQNLGTISQGQSFGRTTDGVQTWRIFTSPTPGQSNGSTATDNVYVDDNQNCSGNFPCFSTIQAAIEAVVADGTVNVAGGKYYENLEIEKSLTLLGDPGNEDVGPGEDAPTVYGDCSGDPVISIEANDVTVSGFIVIEDGCDGSNIYINGSTSDATIFDNDINEASYYGVELGSGSSNNQILRNLIHDNGDYGIYNNGSTNTTITQNDIYYNKYGGIGMGGSGDVSGTQITNNDIHENYNTGIYVGGVTFSDLAISNNSNIDSNEGYGIYLDGVTDGELTISGNSITNNYSDGIYIEQIEQESTVNITGNTVSSNNQNEWSYAGIYINNVYDSIVNIQNNGNISNNSGYGIYICAEGECTNSIVTISGNSVSGNNSNGVYFNDIVSSTVTIGEAEEDDRNTITNNGSTGIYIQYIGTLEESADPSTVTILNNNVSGNSGYGIYLYDTDETSEVTIGEDNTISDNTDAGVYLDSGVEGVEITGNTIQNNGSGGGDILFTGIVNSSGASGNQAHQNIIAGNGVGVQNNDEDEDVFDATLNFWGSILGPFHEFLNPEGEGNNSVSDRVLFSPFYTVNTDGVLSAPNTLELELEDISSFVANGIFEMPEDWVEGDDFVDLLTILQEIEFNFSVDGGETNVVLPAGVEIFRSEEGEEFAWADLALEDIAESILSGLPSGFVMEEAIQWGIPGVELEFSDAITLSIFVGTDLNGQTLNVVRSTSGSGGWISDGIEPPATCTVAAGVCTFQATKASYYATTRTVASSSSGSTTQALSSAGGGGTPPVCSDSKPGSAPALLSAIGGVNSVILNWSKAKDPLTYYLATYGLAPGLQQYGNPNIGGSGTSSYTVSGLSGGTTYYFKVRAGNGCAPGDFSNELSATPAGGAVSGPAAGFAPGVLGEATFSAEITEEVKKSDVSSQTPEVLGEEQEGKPTPTVVDSLIKNKWPIIVTITLVALFIFWYYRKPS